MLNQIFIFIHYFSYSVLLYSFVLSMNSYKSYKSYKRLILPERISYSYVTVKQTILTVHRQYQQTEIQVNVHEIVQLLNKKMRDRERHRIKSYLKLYLLSTELSSPSESSYSIQGWGKGNDKDTRWRWYCCSQIETVDQTAQITWI